MAVEALILKGDYSFKHLFFVNRYTNAVVT